MKQGTTYFRHIKIEAGACTIYASDVDLSESFGVMVHQEGRFKFFVREDQMMDRTATGAEPNALPLPDEQSWSTLFPLDLLLGRRRALVHAMDEITQRLRAGSSPVKCFFKGCKKRAVFFATVPNSGGSWYSCSEQHMSRVTTKGYPIPEGGYKPIRLVGTGERPLLERRADLQRPR